MRPAKRKGKEPAASALTKPFRSPLLVDPNKNESLFEKKESQILKGANDITPQNVSFNHQTSPSLPIAATPAGPSKLTHLWHSLSSPIKSSSYHSRSDDQEYIKLRRQYNSLLLQHKDLTASLDNTLQALKIVQSNKDKDLEGLVKKWRSASREAAEELFSTAKERVNHMGGVNAWRDRYMRPRENRIWDTEPEIDEDDLTEEQKEQLDTAREEAQIEAEKYSPHQTKLPANVEEDDSFTIDMMLRQLNIDLEMIGYDTEMQGWRE